MGKRSREKRERMGREEIQPKREKPEIRLAAICKGIILAGTGLLLFTPLIISGNFFFPFVGPKSLYFMGLTQIIFAAWLILAIFEPKYRPRLNILLIALILFVAILILATVFGADPSQSFWSKYERMTGLLMWFHLLAFFLVISSVFGKKDWIRIFSISIFVGVILSFITFFSENPAMRGGATIGNSSFMGTYLLFNIFLALYLLLRSTGGLRVYSAVALFIIGLALFLSDARAAQLSFLGGIILLIFLYLSFVPKKKILIYLGRFLFAGSIITFLILAFLLFQPGSFVQQKFVQLATQSRLVVWEKAWQGFLERPLLGWGPENFDFVFTKYFNPCMFLPECGGEIWFDRAHNIIFDTLATTGILGFLGYLGIFLSIFYLLWRNYFRKQVDPVRNSKIQKNSSSSNFLPLNAEISNGVEFWTFGIFSVLLISYFVQNLTVFDMVSSYLMFFLVLGFVGSLTGISKKSLSPKFISWNPWHLSLISILFLFLFFYFIIQPLKTGYYVISALRVPPASEERLIFYKKALESSPLGKYQIRDFFGQAVLEFAQSGKVKEVPIENFKKEIDFVIGELEKSIKEAPLDFRSHLKLGQLYNAYATLIDSTKISEAERVLTRAIEISSTNQQGYWSLAQTRLHQEKFEEAFSLAEKAVELEPNLQRSHFIVIQIAQWMGDSELAEKKMKEALSINPAWEKDLKKILEKSD